MQNALSRPSKALLVTFISAAGHIDKKVANLMVIEVDKAASERQPDKGLSGRKRHPGPDRLGRVADSCCKRLTRGNLYMKGSFFTRG